MTGPMDGADSTDGESRGYRDTAAVDLVPSPRPVPGDSRPIALLTEPDPGGAGERTLDTTPAAVPEPDPIELAVLDAQGLLCAEKVISERALPAFDQAALDW